MKTLTKKEIRDWNLTLRMFNMKYCNITDDIYQKYQFANGHSKEARKIYNKKNKKNISDYNQNYYNNNSENLIKKRIKKSIKLCLRKKYA